MQRNARRGENQPNAHSKRQPQLYLQSPLVYFDAHCDHSLPCAQVSSETTQRTRWTPKTFESTDQARCARCTCWSSTIGSAATKFGAEHIGAQACVEAFNRRCMTIKARSPRAGASPPAYNPPYQHYTVLN